MKSDNKLSKYLSYILRHNPDSIGLELDKNGWADIDELIKKTTNFSLNRFNIDLTVQTNDKQRFSISEDGLKIRANQGHTIEIDLDLKSIKPPPVLYHGTASRFIDSIIREGLTKQKRHHVHLTESLEIASSVGNRYGKLVLLSIFTNEMINDGYIFFKTVNNVWLVDNVPFKYLVKL